MLSDTRARRHERELLRNQRRTGIVPIRLVGACEFEAGHSETIVAQKTPMPYRPIAIYVPREIARYFVVEIVIGSRGQLLQRPTACETFSADPREGTKCVLDVVDGETTFRMDVRCLGKYQVPLRFESIVWCELLERA